MSLRKPFGKDAKSCLRLGAPLHKDADMPLCIGEEVQKGKVIEFCIDLAVMLRGCVAGCIGEEAKLCKVEDVSLLIGV